MSTWGNTQINIIVGSLSPYVTQPVLTEIALLPDPLDLSAVSTVIQQQGRKRKRVKAKLRFESLNDYVALVSDFDTGTKRTLSDSASGISGEYLIENIGEPEFVQDDCIFAEVAWLEV